MFVLPVLPSGYQLLGDFDSDLILIDRAGVTVIIRRTSYPLFPGHTNITWYDRLDLGFGI